MKTIKYIAVILVVLGLGFIISRNWSKTPVAIAPNPDTTTGEVRTMCYIWNTEAGDSATLRMNLSGGGGTDVTGSFDFIPAEKDQKTGPIEGTAGPVDPVAMARTANLIWTATGEGVTNREQLKVIFGEGTATPGFGEMKEEGGVYVYAHPDQVSYDLALQQTDCGDPAVQ